MIFYILKSFAYTILCDSALRLLFGNKSRWFQLHAIMNAYNVYCILPDVLKIYMDPKQGYSIIENDYTSYDIMTLHIYHLIFFSNLKFYDYFHHILFIGFGVIPNIYFIKSNGKYLIYIALCGIPGIIEYTSLSFCKHGLIYNHTQKQINYYLYLFFRYPLCVCGVVYNILGQYNNLINDWYPMTVYFNCLALLNSLIFTHLTIKSYLISIQNTFYR